MLKNIKNININKLIGWLIIIPFGLLLSFGILQSILDVNIKYYMVLYFFALTSSFLPIWAAFLLAKSNKILSSIISISFFFFILSMISVFLNEYRLYFYLIYFISGIWSGFILIRNKNER